MGHRTKAKVYLKAWLINLNDRPRNQMKHYYSIENYKEKRLLNFIDTPKKTKVTDESRDSMNILKVVSPNIKRSYSCQGITEATGDQIKFYIAEQLRVTANSSESKELFMMDDTMKSIFSGTGIITNDGVKIISRGGNNFNLRSSKCEMSFVSNVSSRCKHCRPHIKKVYNIIHRSSPPTTNHSKYTKINIIAKNPVSADFEIRNIRNVNFNLRRKVTRIKNKERLERFGQTTCNEDDKNLINKIFLNAHKNISTILDPDSKEMELWKVHYEHISSVKKNI